MTALPSTDRAPAAETEATLVPAVSISLVFWEALVWLSLSASTDVLTALSESSVARSAKAFLRAILVTPFVFILFIYSHHNRKSLAPFSC